MVTTPQAKIEAAAAQLFEAARTGQPCEPVRTLLAEGDVEGAYAAQTINTTRALQAGRRLVGRKIGLTSLAVQKQLGVHQPDYGMLFADMARGDGEDISVRDVMQPKVEAEIAFVIGRDLAEEQLTFADLHRAIEYALPAIEIVGSRDRRTGTSRSPTPSPTTPHPAFTCLAPVLAASIASIRACAGMVMEKRGEPVSVGAGAACMGSPLNAALWLAKVMARAGSPLKAGDTILSGALGPMVTVAPGDVYDVRINGLGSVRAAFSKE